jgi:tripartite-type tricarboxylate transporter receptor subunit TctC
MVVAPPRTPIEIRRQLATAVAGALASEDVQRSLARLGGEARPSTPEETAAFLAEQQQSWSRIVKATGISVE